MILPEIRSSFGRSEAAILVHLLEREGLNPAEWRETLAERGIDPLLDHPAAARAVLGEPGISRLPLPLVAYILLRRSLLEAGVESRHLADYLASIFVEVASSRRPFRIAEYDDREYHYLVDIIEDLSDHPDARRAFLLRAHLGNFALWLSGLFPDWIARRVDRKGGPGLDYYEEMGQTGFAMASEDPFAKRQSLDTLYREAAETFRVMRRALNAFSDRYLTPRASSPIDRLLRQARNDFEGGWMEA